MNDGYYTQSLLTVDRCPLTLKNKNYDRTKSITGNYQYLF